MKNDQRIAAFPAELAIASGIAFMLSGMFVIAIPAGFLWFVLRRVKPTASSDLLLTTSILSAAPIVIAFGVAIGMFPSSQIIECTVVGIVALLLFFTNAYWLAYLLIVHSGWVGASLFLRFRGEELSDVAQRAMVGALLLKALIIWMLVSYLRNRSKKPLKDQPNLQSDTSSESGQPNKDPLI